MTNTYESIEAYGEKQSTLSPMSREQWTSIYQNPLSMTIGQFVIIMQLAKERISELEEVKQVMEEGGINE